MKKFFKFAIIGTIGFVVDATILLIFVNILNIEIYISRIISFCFAVLITWLLNRKFTFDLSSINIKKSKEYIYYFIIQFIGVLINYTIFIILINQYLILKQNLIIPLAIASIIAMFFNFYMLKIKLYKQ